jgi:protoporphyrinogen/coproporphyrinogen III oxidase
MAHFGCRRRMKAAVIGGGISGLTTAYYLRAGGAHVTVFEAGPRAGGNIGTEKDRGFLIEHGPNSILANREVLQLVDDLGLQGELERPKASALKRYVLRNNEMAALPAGIFDLFAGSSFSWSGKLGILKEPFIRSRSTDGETVAQFFGRRFGKEIVEYAVDPFVSGIYAGDPHKLSIRNAFPKLVDHESRTGSVILGSMFSPEAKAERLPKGSPRSFTFKKGLRTLIDSLMGKLSGNVLTQTPVSNIRRSPGGYSLETPSGEDEFSSVVISVPALVAAQLTREMDASPVELLGQIDYPPVTVVYLGYEKSQIENEPDGFGVLVPSSERKRILGCLFTSSVFENRAPGGHHLLTVFIGGARDRELCSKDDPELVRMAAEEMASILEITGEPVFATLKRWPRAIPQYNVGYENVIGALEAFSEEHPGIFFCSNFYKGISVGDCIRNSGAAARKVAEYMALTSTK